MEATDHEEPPMSITIELAPETEARLRDQAEAAGQERPTTCAAWPSVPPTITPMRSARRR
jgi:hypothetical protein